VDAVVHFSVPPCNTTDTANAEPCLRNAEAAYVSAMVVSLPTADLLESFFGTYDWRWLRLLVYM
jgi:hypothetical protein